MVAWTWVVAPRGAEKWLDSGCTFKEEPVGFFNSWDVGVSGGGMSSDTRENMRSLQNCPWPSWAPRNWGPRHPFLLLGHVAERPLA